MPDRDTVNTALKPHYQKAFAQLSEGFFGRDDIARSIADPLRKDIETYGVGSLDLIETFSIELGSLINSPLFKLGTDWHDARRKLLQTALNVKGNKRGIDLAFRACERLMSRLRSQRDLYYPDLYQDTIKAYLFEIYLADFADPALLQDGYQNDSLSRDEVEAELDALRPHIEEILEYFAGQVARNQSIDKLRLPPVSRSRQPSIDLHSDNLMKLGERD